MNFVPDAINNLRPGAQWGMTGNTIYWLDTNQTQPTKEEIASEVLRLKTDYPRKVFQRLRAAAYTAEADPLFFKVQRGEATQADYDAKVAEIRTRYPYPQEVI